MDKVASSLHPLISLGSFGSFTSGTLNSDLDAMDASTRAALTGVADERRSGREATGSVRSIGWLGGFFTPAII